MIVPPPFLAAEAEIQGPFAERTAAPFAQGQDESTGPDAVLRMRVALDPGCAGRADLDLVAPEPLRARLSLDDDRPEPGLGERLGDPEGAAVSLKRQRRQRHRCSECGVLGDHAAAAKTRPQMPRLTIRQSEKSTGRFPSSMPETCARTPPEFSRPG